jgi:hypothetical protein
MTLKLYGFSSLSLFPKETTALRGPTEVGLNWSVKVVDPLGAIIEIVGCWITVKSGLPVMLTIGLPFNMRFAVPKFSIVKVVMAFILKLTLPKSIVPPLGIFVLTCLTLISGIGLGVGVIVGIGVTVGVGVIVGVGISVGVGVMVGVGVTVGVGMGVGVIVGVGVSVGVDVIVGVVLGRMRWTVRVRI